MEVLTLRDGYDHRKNPASYSFRRMTLDEIKALVIGARYWFLARDGSARQLTINGSIKRWKREADRLEVPVKYGMYECARLDTREALARLLVKLEPSDLN